jgi:hypothetical protein
VSTLKSINVIHPSSATNNIVNDASGNVAIGNNLTVAGTATVGGVAAVAVAPSTAGNVLTSTGSAWASSAPTGGAINVQTFTSSGTWTKPAYAAGSRVLVQCWGGGGSGGKNSGGGGAGGAGGGGYNERWLSLSQMGATETATVGAGGTALSATGVGNTGGTTSLGSLIFAYGGGGGGNAVYTNGTGGGQLSAGNSSGSPFMPGYPLISVSSSGGFFGVEAWQGSGGNSAGLSRAFSHGGGGAAGLAGQVADPSVWGGGGGGATSTNTSGGVSSYGGNGGAGGATGTAGTQPAGGGGGSTSGNSGAGAAGQIIVTVFPA